MKKVYDWLEKVGKRYTATQLWGVMGLVLAVFWAFIGYSCYKMIFGG